MSIDDRVDGNAGRNLTAAEAGRQIQEELPEIADDLRSGMDHSEILSKYDIQERYGLGSPSSARIALVCAVGGCKSGENPYGPLIPPEELEEPGNRGRTFYKTLNTV